MKLRTTCVTLLLATVTLAFAACGDDAETGGGGSGEPVQLVLEAEDALFPGFEYETGLLPDGSPVKAAFTVSARGETSISATCAVSGSKSKPVLTGLPDGGKIAIDGGFAMLGRLVVEGVPGIDDYDGDIPGIENVDIAVVGDGAFDPFAIDDEVSATADIPEADLPPIPLGSIPGELQLHIGAGSFVEIGWSGTCAGIDEEHATYSGTILRSGTLVIEPKIVIDALLDTLEFEIPSFTIDLALGSTDASARAEVTEVGAKPEGGETVDASCEGSGAGGRDGGGDGGGAQSSGAQGSGAQGTTSTSSLASSTSSGSNVTTGGTSTCFTEEDCSGFPCIDGVCSRGFCDSGLSIGDEAADACISASCCEEVEACTYEGADVEGCYDCLVDGEGPRCDSFLVCARENCFGWPICDSGLADLSESAAECLGDACCDEFNLCTSNASAPADCVACMQAGGGPLCDAALECSSSSCAI